MKIIYLYGPDGSGKTFIAKELLKNLERAIIIPFEPGKFGNLIEKIDSGYNGEGSAVNKAIPKSKSFFLYMRYILRIILFKLKFNYEYKYAIFTRGPLEFGINDTHKNFPKFFGKLLQNIISEKIFLIVRPVETILFEKPELPRSRILSLYEEYLLSGCKPVINIDKNTCLNTILKEI